MHDLAEGYLYSMHMVQHLMFTLVAAPLLIAGTPAWLWRALLRPRPVFVVWRFLTRPVVALILFNGLLLFTHWPELVEASVGSAWVHFTLHTLILGSAIVMWWPVMSPLPELPALAPPAQMLYLFVQSIAPDGPGVVPDVRAHAALPRVRDVPPDLGHVGAHRPARGRARHEDRRRADPVGVHRDDLLPLARA